MTYCIKTHDSIGSWWRDRMIRSVCEWLPQSAQAKPMTRRVIYSEHNQRTSLSASLWSCELTVASSLATGVSKVGPLSWRCGPWKLPPSGRQRLNAKHRVPVVLLSVGDILEKTQTAASFALFLCGSLVSGKLRAPLSLHHRRLAQSSDLSKF